jgi:hypothetical protein
VLTSELTVIRSSIESLPGGIMSVRNVFVLLLALSALAFSVACGGGSGTLTNPQAPPTGGFTDSDLNGTYVFSVSGTDENGAPYSIVGDFTANGAGTNTGGGITSGTLDINDADTSEFSGPVAGASITSGSSYSVSVDGRGQVSLETNIGSGFPKLVFDFVLQDNSHGLVTEFDTFGSGSGTLDLQSSGVTPAGSYAFILSGASYTGSAWAAAGNFAYTGGSIAGLEDINEGGLLNYNSEALSGSFSVGPSSTPATTLVTPVFPGGMLFDVFAIDADHFKLIEMDTNATLSGDAFSQSTAALPTGSIAFTLSGLLGAGTSAVPFAAGGIMTNSSGTVSGTEDYSEGSTASTTSGPFTAAFTAGGTGRYTLGSFATFVGGGSYAAYPSSGGLLLVEIDTAGVTSGAAFAQTSTTFAPDGYGLNLSGTNLGAATGSAAEVDDIAEFTASSSGSTVTGIIDENYAPGASGPIFDLALSGNYTAPVSGRGTLVATAGTNSNSTLNGGFGLTFYTVDGTTFPFIENDGGQVAAGVFVLQSGASVTPAIAKAHAMYVPHPIFHPHSAAEKKQ